MTNFDWCTLREVIMTLKRSKVAMSLATVRWCVRELETILDRESGDDEKPSHDDD